MNQDEIIGQVAAKDGVLIVRPSEGDGTPELSWGDTFLYYAPDGVMPTTTQPFATIVTKDYPGDAASQLSRAGVFRLNIQASQEDFGELTRADEPVDPASADVLFAHPVYGAAHWLCVVNPGPRTASTVRRLLDAAYARARQRYERRRGRTDDQS